MYHIEDIGCLYNTWFDLFFLFLPSVLLNQSKEVIAVLGISIHLDGSALRTVDRGKGF